MNDINETSLVLAAEDCEPSNFDDFHIFSSRTDRRVLLNLTAHGPVLLRGGRGSGKSALMIAASRQLDPVVSDASAVGIYMSLRHAPLLKSTGEAYGRILCSIVIEKIRETLGERAASFDPDPEVGSVQFALSKLAASLKKRIVLYFDDAAHLGREASLEEFFDIYRTLSSSAVSCKAAIYPGVTRFGIRFDVYNDATVIDLLRSEELPDFASTFLEVMNSRYPEAFESAQFSSRLDKNTVASLLAQAVLGNMRGFIFACNALKDRCADGRTIGLPELNETLLELASNYYWPLLDEIRPKLGIYEPMVETARTRYALNLCNILEQTHRSRLTKALLDTWTAQLREEAIQFSKGSKLATIDIPDTLSTTDLAIFSQEVSVLKQSNAYPYGLSDHKIQLLQDAGYHTVGDLIDAPDDELDAIYGIGSATLLRIRNVLGQAIWM